MGTEPLTLGKDRHMSNRQEPVGNSSEKMSAYIDSIANLWSLWAQDLLVDEGIQGACRKSISELAELSWSLDHFSSTEAAASDLVRITAELIRQGPAGTIPSRHRKAHAFANLVSAMHDAYTGQWASAIVKLDTALILGATKSGIYLEDEIRAMAELVHALIKGTKITARKRRRRRSTSSSRVDVAYERPAWQQHLSLTPLTRVHSPSLLNFKQAYLEPHGGSPLPVVLEGCLEHWTALDAWSTLDGLLDEAGPRLVPVETGGQYTNETAGQVLMTLEHYIENHVRKGDASAYMAQHRLFDQIPALAERFSVPDYCALVGDGSGDIITMAWLGCVGVVSPCHHDPYHNLLAQISGRKRVLLFPPDACMYPRRDFMTNTSDIDLTQPVDSTTFPDFEWSAACEVLLSPGDMLFIPRHWWHFVEAVSSTTTKKGNQDASTSVSASAAAAAANDDNDDGDDDDSGYGNAHVTSISFWFGDRILKEGSAEFPVEDNSSSRSRQTDG